VADEIGKILKSRNGIKVMILGGDDLLIKYDSTKYGSELLEEIRTLFQDKTGLSMSCGVGKNIAESIQNLRLAKLYGKNQIKGFIVSR